MKIIRSWLVFILLFSFLYSQNPQEGLDKNVTVNFKNTPMSVVLKIMSTNYNFNYVISQVGSEKITVSITNVPLKNALNAILLPMGYHYYVQDDMVIIKKIENSASNELSVSVYKCKYLPAEKVMKIVEQVLSSSGSVTVLAAEKNPNEKIVPVNNILIIKDISYKIDEAMKILTQIDIKEKQIMIEVKLVERTFGDNKAFGVSWPTQVGVKTKSFEPQNMAASGGGGGGQAQEEFTGWLKELPKVSDDWQWGVVALKEMEMYLDMLRVDNNSQIIANPKVVTENGSPAIINVSTTVPIPELQRSPQGDLITYKDKDVASYIEVSPIINVDGSITLKIHPKLEEIIGYTSVDAGFPQPIVAKREIRTVVTVGNEEAVIIGGLVKETESKVINKVFLLGDIPVLGYLFRHNSIKKEKSDLLIVITPKVVE